MGIGLIIGLLGSAYWLLLLIAFAVIAFAATLFGLTKKTEDGLQEGAHGERGYKNILGVGIPPCIIAVLSVIVGDSYDTLMSVAYVSTVAVAAADTVASEIGVRDPKVWLITTFKPCPPGTNGGVSVLGTLASLLAAMVTAILGWILVIHEPVNALVVIPVFSGMLGNILDSLFGAWFENKGYISKYENNCLTGILGAIIGALVAVSFL